MLNKIILIGRLGKDAVQRGSAAKPIIFFSLAVSPPTTGTGEERDTQWFQCAAFGSKARYLKSIMPMRGQLVAVEGRLKTHTYVDSKGIERESVDVMIEHFQFLERKSDASPDNEPSQAIGGEAQWQRAPRWDDSAAPPRDPRDLWK